MRRWYWIILMGLMFIVGKPERAAACSGVGGYRAFLSDALDSEYIVIGQFVDLDDAELNGIFHVDEYLAGRAGEHLLLALKSAWTIRNPRVMCSSALAPLEMNTPYLFFLTRQLDGSFESSVWMLFPYSDEEMKYTLHVDWDREREVYITQEFSFDELRATILAHEADDSHTPLAAHPYPLTAPILLTTLDDEQYLVPVDGAVPVRLTDEQITGLRIEPIGCIGIPCQAMSPNRIDQARLITEGQELQLTYPVIQLHARSVLFSSTSELLAVWYEDRIDIYLLPYPELLGYQSRYTQPHVLNSVSIQPIQPFDIENVDLRAAWTPDGRWLAYSDLNGLWIWDALTPNQQPNLLLPTVDTQVPLARVFSGEGRYLSVQQGNERFILDVDTGIRLPDGLVAANDRSMLVFDTFQSRWKPSEIYRMWLPSQAREDMLNFVYTDEIYQIDRRPQGFALSGCGTIFADNADGTITSHFSCGIAPFTPSMFSPYRGEQGYIFAYEPYTEQLAAIRDEAEIWIDGRIVDLSNDISSPIMQIEWLPSLFYYDS